MRSRTNLLMTTVILLTAGTAGAYAADKDEMIKNAMSAAPKAVGENASVVTFDDKMNMVVLKKGTNGFTCLPNDPTTPSNDPMCVDENGLAWTMALIKKEPAPPEGKGFRTGPTRSVEICRGGGDDRPACRTMKEVCDGRP